MTLRLADRWVWDFWLARDGSDHHLFFLQAPRSLGDPELRHRHATVGHAVSSDLSSWELLPDALLPGPPGAWDDVAIWTGSVIFRDGQWVMLYTGTCRAEGALVQRIGLATSPDLLHWDKHPANPVLNADPCWYELLDLDSWHDQAWRDPFLVQPDGDGALHALITARVGHGPPEGRGVIGHARSLDGVAWEVLAPLTEPRDFGHLEVPQVVAIGERWYLLFSSNHWSTARCWSERTGRAPADAVHVWAAGGPLGPFTPLDDESAVAPSAGHLYSGKVVFDSDGRPRFLAFRDRDERGSFVGEIVDPLDVTVHEPSGRLRIG